MESARLALRNHRLPHGTTKQENSQGNERQRNKGKEFEQEQTEVTERKKEETPIAFPGESGSRKVCRKPRRNDHAKNNIFSTGQNANL